VSILGYEGKGKSTVLNALFDTEFVVANVDKWDELLELKTTSGVDVAVSNGLIILDVEGFDSASRQEKPREGVKRSSSRQVREEVKAERNIEDKFALFVLLSTDVIIINLMVSDCKSYHASGMKTLETIFKAAQQLHLEQRLRTKKIMFFVRDVWKQNPKPIEASINASLREVFAKTGLRESSIRAMINISIVTLPNYLLCREGFNAELHKVKAGLSKQGLIKEFKSLPSRFIVEAFKLIWDAVLTNETMNLPDINSVINDLQRKAIQRETELDLLRRMEGREGQGRTINDLQRKAIQRETELDLLRRMEGREGQGRTGRQQARDQDRSLTDGGFNFGALICLCLFLLVAHFIAATGQFS
jgi:hypothetical protein